MTGRRAAPVVEVTRVTEFSAAHRLHSPYLSEQANRALYGKCNNSNGHGHTYRLEATIAGPLDPDLGLLAAAVRLDEALSGLAGRFDGAHLDHDIPELAATSRTSEQLADLLRRLLVEAVGPALRRVVLYETPNNIFEAAAARQTWPSAERAAAGRRHD